jgi:hypothetical protein
VPQQTPPTQKPEAQSAAAEHAEPVFDANVAVTPFAAVTVTLQVIPLADVQPDHDEKAPVADGEATSWTLVP